jgi:alpha-ketoglutaric semialdehyde dehydrogenase
MDQSFMTYPTIVPNLIGHEEKFSLSRQTFLNINPHSGTVICEVTASNEVDIDYAVVKAQLSQRKWSSTPAVVRGRVLFEIVDLLAKNRNELAKIVSEETGKSLPAALGEVNGAIDLARFYAAEGQRLYGRTTGSGVENKHIYHIKEPIGIAGLIISANTPIANVAWKVFPALICGNAAILKASEDAPLTSYFFGKIVSESNLPDGVLSIIQGRGTEAGTPLVRHPNVGVISFTGSTSVGKLIAVEAGKRLAKVSLELGGKNPLVVCADADLDKAIKWILLSGFSNAGQRCAAASRVIIFESVYSQLKEKLISSASKLKLGIGEKDDFGPVINQRQLHHIIDRVNDVKNRGAKILHGGNKSMLAEHTPGFYIEPTIIEGVDPNDVFSQTELFGPVITLYKAKDLSHAIELSNNSSYGLTSCIHTTNFENAITYSRLVEAGVCNVNGPTYGSEPHLPFGGVKNSGNGTREPGSEAIDIYTSLKTVSYIL